MAIWYDHSGSVLFNGKKADWLKNQLLEIYQPQGPVKFIYVIAYYWKLR